MATYLLTWNPDRWNWTDLTEKCSEVINGTDVELRWSCRNHQVTIGDRVFLLRQRVETRGIFASGKISSGIFEDDHFDVSRPGETTTYIKFRPDILLDPDSGPILYRDQLNQSKRATRVWNSQSSGIVIPDDLAQELENKWSSLLEEHNPSISRQSIQTGGGYGNNAVHNAEVEEAAILAVTKEYQSDGWDVVSVELNKCGYDLRCRKGNHEENVEVKGNSGLGDTFILTAGEVRQVKENERFVICLVRNALSKPIISKYTGKKFLEKFDLKPTQYRATLK